MVLLGWQATMLICQPYHFHEPSNQHLLVSAPTNAIALQQQESYNQKSREMLSKLEENRHAGLLKRTTSTLLVFQ